MALPPVLLKGQLSEPQKGDAFSAGEGNRTDMTSTEKNMRSQCHGSEADGPEYLRLRALGRFLHELPDFALGQLPRGQYGKTHSRQPKTGSPLRPRLGNLSCKSPSGTAPFPLMGTSSGRWKSEGVAFSAGKVGPALRDMVREQLGWASSRGCKEMQRS